MTFDKLPINNRVICNSRLFGGPRQSALGTSSSGGGVKVRDVGHVKSVDWDSADLKRFGGK